LRNFFEKVYGYAGTQGKREKAEVRRENEIGGKIAD
jgi:hypothetical protein